jgi:hypothetical protein
MPTGARGSGYVSPRNPTGRAFQDGLKRKQLDDAAKERQRQALADLAGNGGRDTDLAEISERHGGADVVVEDDGTIVVRYV